MAGFEDLLALAQAQGGQGGQPMPPVPGGSSPDLLGQLQALLAQGGGGGGMPRPATGSPGGMPMQAGRGTDPMVQALNQVASGSPGGMPMPRQKMPPTEMDIAALGDGRMADKDYDRYFGKGSANAMGPYAGAEAETRRGKPKTTEQELADVSANMGEPDPVKDGNFPSQQEINALKAAPTDGNIANFERKWGRGSAVEIMDGDGTGPDYVYGDDEDTDNDPTTRKIPALKNKRKNDDDGDHEYR